MWSKGILFCAGIALTAGVALASGCGDDDNGRSTLPTGNTSTSSSTSTSTSTSGAGGDGGGGSPTGGSGGTEQGCMYCACSCAFQSVQVKDYEFGDYGVSTCEELHNVSCDDDPPANFESCEDKHVYPCEW